MPTQNPFEALLDDLIAVQERRTTQPPTPDAASRIARHAHEAARNRRMAQQRPLKKSEPLPEYKPDWAGLQARQERIAAGMEQSRQQAQQDAIREHLATLAAAAKAGRLTAHQACLLDVYRGQALSLGLEP